MKLTRRIKNSLKCLLGKPINIKIESQEYHITVDQMDIFNDKFIIVTGGTGAIGSAICYEFAARGATVGICGRDLTKIKSIISLVQKHSPSIAQKLKPVTLDVNNEKQIELAFSDFIKNFGKLDLLVNNAGGQPGRVGKYNNFLFNKDIDQIDLCLNTNLRGTILCSRIACQIMAMQKFGHIVSMASVIGIGGKSGYSDYAASKAAIIGFTKSLALEMAQFNVRVNCISPGSVNQVPFDYSPNVQYTNLNPTHRTGFTKEIAETVSFLENNKFITGQNIIVDGGRSLGLFGDN